MSWTAAIDSVRGALNIKLFTVGDTTVTPATLLVVALVVLVTLYTSRIARRGVERALARRDMGREATVGTINSLLHYALLFIGFGIAAQTIGIKLSTLFAAGAVFAVGLGFAMQTIVQNFASGIILLVERSIKPGDVLDLKGTVVKVTEMRIRSALVRSRDGEDLIVPNSALVQSTVKNYTMRDAIFRLRVPVGVVYSSDMDLVFRTLRRVADEVDWRLQKPKPLVLMTAFGDSSVNFEVSVWIDDPWHERRARSELHKTIWDALAAEGVTIAFPQLDVHFDPPVSEGLRAIGGGEPTT